MLVTDRGTTANIEIPGTDVSATTMHALFDLEFPTRRLIQSGFYTRRAQKY